MSKRKIFITGAGGFVGGWVQRALAAHVENGEAEVRGSGVDLSLDITDRSATVSAIRDFRPDAVIHLAAVAAPGDAREDPDRAWNVNVDGTINLARAVLEEAPEALLVYASSSEVYGRTFEEHSEPLDERALLQPNTFYGASKAAADILLGQMAGDGLKVIRFRPFNHTGPGQPPRFLIPSLANQIARIEAGLRAPVLRVGNLDVKRDFLDVRDVVRAYVDTAMAPPGVRSGAIFNLASGRALSVGEIVDWFICHATVKISVEQDRALMRPGEVRTVCGNSAKVERELGWRPEIGIEVALAEMLEHGRSIRRLA